MEKKRDLNFLDDYATLLFLILWLGAGFSAYKIIDHYQLYGVFPLSQVSLILFYWILFFLMIMLIFRKIKWAILIPTILFLIALRAEVLSVTFISIFHAIIFLPLLIGFQRLGKYQRIK